MKEFERCLGLPVIAMDTAEEIGVATHFVTDPWANRVVGFVVSGVDGLAERRAFRFGDVVNFGEDAVILEAQAALKPVSQVGDLLPHLSPIEEQPRRTAWTSDGQNLGTILGRSFDERDARLLTYDLYLHSGGDPVVIPASAMVSSARGMALFLRDALPLDFGVVETSEPEASLVKEPVVAAPQDAVVEHRIVEVPAEDEDESVEMPVYASLFVDAGNPPLPEPVSVEPELRTLEVVAVVAVAEEEPVRAKAAALEAEAPIEFVAAAEPLANGNGNGHGNGYLNGNGHHAETVALNGNGHVSEEDAKPVAASLNGYDSNGNGSNGHASNGHEAEAAVEAGTNGNGHAPVNGNGHAHANGSETNGQAAPKAESRIDEQVRRFMPLLVGCHVGRDIHNDMGETVISQGQEVTPELVLTAWKVNRLFDLYTASQNNTKATPSVL